MTALADEVVARLRAHGVELVFGIPGTHNLELFRALGAAGVRVVDAHHEQGLGYAADAWSRVTGRPAVVVTTTGPGITNLITALATSAAASVPILAIAPGVPDAALGRGTGWLHDLPSQTGTLGTVVRAFRASSVAEAAAFIDAVHRNWATGRRAPAYLELPVDLLDAVGDLPEASITDDASVTDEASIAGEATGAPSVTDPLGPAVFAAAEALAAARRPAIVVGRGGCGPRAARAIRELAEALGAPVLTTANAKGVLDETHPLALGLALRLDAGRMLLREADRVLVVGTDLGPSEFWGPCPLVGEQVIRVDIDPAGMVANIVPERMLRGDAEVLVPALADAVRADTDADAERRTVPASDAVAEPRPGRSSTDRSELPPWAAAHVPGMRAQMAREGAAYRALHEIMLDELRLAGLDDVAVAGDSSQATYLGTAYFWPMRRPNRFLYPAGYGTLGYAVPAAIGAALTGVPERAVAVTGEGGLMFSVQEIATAARLGLAIPIVVCSNGGFREIREGMLSRGIAPAAVDFAAPDFAQLARAMGADGERVPAGGLESPDGFRAAFRRALEASGPYVVDVTLPA
jgi:acetolactate synthase-1/2/3 large subunit